MRVLCPSCQQLVTVPDSAAGQMTACPQCGKSFMPPALTGAAIDAAPPPPPPIAAPRVADSTRPPDGSAPATIAGAATATPVRPTSDRCCTCTLRKDVVRWVAPIALFVCFVLSFFTWVAAAPNGTRILTQGGWQAMRDV